MGERSASQEGSDFKDSGVHVPMPDGNHDQVRQDMEAVLRRQDKNVPHCANDSPTHVGTESRVFNVRLACFPQANAVFETMSFGTDIK